MNIAIFGLGLIGGSLAKAIKLRTDHTVYGYDVQESVMRRARLVEAMDEELTPERLADCEVVLVALYPEAIVECLRERAASFRKGAVVIDCGGIKREICQVGRQLAAEHGWHFVGGHPMAGIEKSGFAAARQNLFARATMILAPSPDDMDLPMLAGVKRLFLELGFGRIRMTTAEEHDRIIAYTSQLPHIVSSAFVKSRTALSHTGFSAGSFKDLTRVATLVPSMWSQLFLDNRRPLLEELDGLMARLAEYREAIAQGDRPRLESLLAEGRDCKAAVDELEAVALAQLEREKNQ